MIKKADSQLIKRMNEIQLLRLIRKYGPVSRVGLAQLTKMSKVAVFDIVGRLIEQKYVREEGKEVSTARGGKRSSLVKINSDHHFVIGVEMKRGEAMVAIANLEARILKTKRFTFEVEDSPEKNIKKIFRRIESLLSDIKAHSDQLIGIGIGIPGIIDYKKGRLRFADTLKGWDKIDLRELFVERFDIPVIIENDVNTIALGENILGAGKDVDDLVCLYIGAGIGAGLIVNGKLRSGFGGSAGEIGYFKFNHHTPTDFIPKFFIGDYTYYGELLSENNFYQILKKELKKRTGADPVQKSLSALLKSKEHRDVTNELFDEYAHYLGILCLDIIKLINPELLVLSGATVESSTYLIEKVKEFISENTKQIPFNTGDICVGKLKDTAGLSGAIALALQVVFEK